MKQKNKLKNYYKTISEHDELIIRLGGLTNFEKQTLNEILSLLENDFKDYRILKHFINDIDLGRVSYANRSKKESITIIFGQMEQDIKDIKRHKNKLVSYIKQMNRYYNRNLDPKHFILNRP